MTKLKQKHKIPSPINKSVLKIDYPWGTIWCGKEVYEKFQELFKQQFAKHNSLHKPKH